MNSRILWLPIVVVAALSVAVPASGWSQAADEPAPPSPPCQQGEIHSQFDFWIGEWDVFSPQGDLAGTNRIEKTQGGCLLVENWTGAGGGTGTSMNFYNPVSRKWIQIWTDPRGTIIDVEGEFRNGAMRFEGLHYYPDGSTQLYRMIFTPNDDGTVRQLIEQSRDQGTTWYVWFDGKYVSSESSEP